MSVAFYYILSVVGVSLHFTDSIYSSNVFLYAIAVPVIDFLALTIKHRRLTIFNFFRSSSFILIAVINYLAFSFHKIPFKYFIFAWIIIGFGLSVYMKRKSFSKYIVRWVIYTLLMTMAIFHSSLTSLQRLNLYTLEDPIYSSKISAHRLNEFAYTYYKNGDKDMAIFLLNRSLDNIDEKLKEDSTLSKETRELLVKERQQIKNNLILVLQNKWVIKGKYIE